METRVMKGSDIISLMNTFSQSTHVWNSTDKKINPNKIYEVEYTIGYGWHFNDEEYKQTDKFCKLSKLYKI